MAATGPDDHVPVLLQDDVGAVVEVEHGDGVELGRGAAWLGHRFWVDEMDLEHTADVAVVRSRGPLLSGLLASVRDTDRLGQTAVGDMHRARPRLSGGRTVDSALRSPPSHRRGAERLSSGARSTQLGGAWPIGHVGPGRPPSRAVPCTEACFTVPLDSTH